MTGTERLGAARRRPGAPARRTRTSGSTHPDGFAATVAAAAAEPRTRCCSRRRPPGAILPPGSPRDSAWAAPPMSPASRWKAARSSSPVRSTPARRCSECGWTALRPSPRCGPTPCRAVETVRAGEAVEVSVPAFTARVTVKRDQGAGPGRARRHGGAHRGLGRSRTKGAGQFQAAGGTRRRLRQWRPSARAAPWWTPAGGTTATRSARPARP